MPDKCFYKVSCLFKTIFSIINFTANVSQIVIFCKEHVPISKLHVFNIMVHVLVIVYILWLLYICGVWGEAGGVQSGLRPPRHALHVNLWLKYFILKFYFFDENIINDVLNNIVIFISLLSLYIPILDEHIILMST